MTRHLKMQFENTVPDEISLSQKGMSFRHSPCKGDRVIALDPKTFNSQTVHCAGGTNVTYRGDFIRELRNAKSIRAFMADGTPVRVKFGEHHPRCRVVDIIRDVY
ncbi:MAG: hypothetical protein PHN51_11795 [Candidatus Nanopelagicales bacterium]|nr:hypothetical protein [Candidatus Nanopelagicales bacterium]